MMIFGVQHCSHCVLSDRGLQSPAAVCMCHSMRNNHSLTDKWKAVVAKCHWSMVMVGQHLEDLHLV